MIYEKWLQERKNGIGGSDAAAILGLSPHKTNVELWEEKRGIREPQDISDEEYVQFGRAAEEPLIQLFALNYPQYSVNSNTSYEMIRHKDYPFLFATLDAKLLEKQTSRKGILETKTALIQSSAMRQKWEKAVPDHYFCQVLHYMNVTGWDYAVLEALLRWDYGDGVMAELRHYNIERYEVQASMDYLLQEEIKFWHQVQTGERPNLKLPPL